MQLKSYHQIEHELSGLNRRDQYAILLQTQEWSDFRRMQLSWSDHMCQLCGRKEGPIKVPMPADEWQRLMDRYEVEREKYKEFRKLPVEQQMQSLLDGTWVGNPPMPYNMIEIGEICIQVHHKLYYFDKLPWQYRNSDILVLCSECHKDVHARETIYTYQDETKRFRKITPRCSKCDGDGYIGAYRHVDNGICWDCGGAGILFDSSMAWEPVN